MLFSVIDDLHWTDEHQSGARVCDRRNRKTDLVLDQILLFFEITQNQDGRKFSRDETFGVRKATVRRITLKSEMEKRVLFANVYGE